ncbi:hypothetical protein BpHYR1_001305 [Brachionus plicatilis]|uniref:Uncharacterized protein n=1 Tax=Brachionus plicatilis TaxID=10195 RepID=A0A3M7T7W1_BRAPC|nr:hypothetical protein BpHYR1_001305 [Brachionus plicatilis]
MYFSFEKFFNDHQYYLKYFISQGAKEFTCASSNFKTKLKTNSSHLNFEFIKNKKSSIFYKQKVEQFINWIKLELFFSSLRQGFIGFDMSFTLKPFVT